MTKVTANREDDLIDLQNAEHVQYWTQVFGINAETLRLLTEHHGFSASHLRIILGK